MKGLELGRRYYEAYGKKLLEEEFPELFPYIAVGLAGSGSECMGYDDSFSCDHDFEPGFCIFLPEEDVIDRQGAFALERAYEKLPREFMGFCRSRFHAVGGNRHGVIRMGDFFEAKTGSRNGELSLQQWLTLPEQALLEAVNGEIFCDNYGQFSAVREKLSYYPEDIRRKKIAGFLLLMGQSGQYNYPRCIARGEAAAAQLAVYEFANSAMQVLFLLEKRYMPYYKWRFRALTEVCRQMPQLPERFAFLLSTGNDADLVKKKTQILEEICDMVCQKLSEQGLTDITACEMERQAYAVNDRIADGHIRNLHILCGV